MKISLALAFALSAFSSPCGAEDAPSEWVPIQEAALEFPLSRGMSVEKFMGSPSFKQRGRSGTFAVGERSTNWSPYAATLPDEVREFQARVPHCVLTSAIREQRLNNGWDCAWAELLCHERVPSPHIVCQAESRRYVVSVSGSDYSIPDILAFVGTGRIVPDERRAALVAQAKKDADPMRDIDEISGGPQIRRKLLLGVLAGIVLMFASVFLWRGATALRVVAVVLWLLYAVFFGPFWAFLGLATFFGAPLFGVPGPVVVGAAAGLLLLSFVAAVWFARSAPKAQ